MRTRWLGLVVLLSVSSARAEVGWLASSARLESKQRFSLFVGPGSVGAGAQWAASEVKRAWSAEASWALFDRVLELRGDHVWVPRRGHWVSLSVGAGLSGYVVPQPFDAGLGPHAALTVDVVRPIFSVATGLQTEIDLFARQAGPRFVERLFFGFAGAVGPVGWAVLSRLGVDLEPGRAFVGRGDVVLEVSWLRERVSGG